MKKILLRTFAFTFLAVGTLASCSSDTTTGVETENTETQSNMESQPNMGGQTGNSVELDSIPTEGEDSTTNDIKPIE